jgi:hypothetical protein
VGTELTGLSGLSSNGYVKRTGSGTYSPTSSVPYTDLSSVPAIIDAFDGLTPAADKFVYYTSSSAASLGTITSFALTLLDDTTASSARSTLGLGTLATQSGTFSGTSSGSNTGDQTISLTGDITGSGTGTFSATISANVVTYGKLQTASANCLLGRSASTGNVEEITCTAAGRAILDDADASAQRATLGLGAVATSAAITLTGDVTGSGTSSFVATIANDAVTYAKMQNVSATDKLLGRSSSGSGNVEEITCTAAGRALLDDVSASAQRTTLGLGTIAVLSSPLGPYADDAGAASGGIAVGSLYYTAAGAVKIRLT